jgi:16S rRNA (cytosine967-C5)-methyltransferase
MTPAARVQAAIEVLDQIIAGSPAEKALTNWARGARYAGSKDRAAVRDHVFDVLRCWRSSAVLGGAETGRGRMLGKLRNDGADLDALFDAQGHGPEALSAQEQAAGAAPVGPDHWDLPDWAADQLQADYGDQAEAIVLSLRHRANVFLRVNLLKTNRDAAIAALAEDGISAEPEALSDTALRVTEGQRRVAGSNAYQTGLIELQDAASQAVVDFLPLSKGARVLDYCAGGGGKTLAMAGRRRGLKLFAHDANQKRMKDLPARAKRAGARVDVIARPKAGYDLVFCDVPCSGSGAWRRSPEGKWRMTQSDLSDLCALQYQILSDCAALVSENGHLAYATCSVFHAENAQQTRRFVQEHPEWQLERDKQFLPEQGGDGFYVAVLSKKS